MSRFVPAVFVLLFSAPFCFGQVLNPRPVKALGVPRLLATQANPGALESFNPNWVEAKDLFNPTAVALDNSTNPPSVYVADTSNNRVLGWRYSSQLVNGAPADIVLGQTSFYATLPQGPGGLTIGLNQPTGITVDPSGNVYVADTGNNRVLRFPQPFLQPDVLKTPDLVIGQPGYSTSNGNSQGLLATSLFLNSNPTFPPHVGVAFNPAGDLFVTDTGNNRVLRYSAATLAAGNNSPRADLVLGQTVYTSSLSANGNRGNKSALTNPTGLAFDSVGRLYVSDSNFRVVVYAPGFVTGIAAVRILGVAVQLPNQPAPALVSEVNIGFAASVTIAPGDRPVVVDAGNNRVLIYDTFANWPAETDSVISPSAQSVIGQISFAARAGNQGSRFSSSSGLLTPFDAAATSTELFVVDAGNHRVLTFPFPPGVSGATAKRVLGQINFTLSSPNFVEGREFSLTNAGSTGSVIIDRSATPPHLYVADTANNRILGFADFNNAKAGNIADLVIGQQNVFSTAYNNLSNDPNAPVQNGLSRPSALALDAVGNLYVADSGNSRVLRFPQPFAQQARTSQPADLVVGQTNFTTSLTTATNRTMQTPSGLAVLSDGSLMVSDTSLNRVLYYPAPLASGMAATKVLGQSDFNSNLVPSATTAFDPARFSSPREIAVDPQDRVFVCDTNNHRVAIFDAPANLTTALAVPSLSLTANLNQPVGITVGAAGTPQAGQVWVTDFAANAAFHFAPFTQLVLNGSPDIAVGSFHPLSAAYDTFGDLVLADSANRVLLFVPQLAITNGSSFATGPVAPGTIISIFPAAGPPSTAPAALATGTANFSDAANPLPLPTALADVQVIVNGIPAPLFFVSPGQINLPLPTNLPTSGTVDLQVVSKSSPRIFGLTELALNAISPGLFTLAAGGVGQLAALNNNADGSVTVNTASTPLVRGRILTLFGTGQGPVPNAPPDGTPPSTAIPTIDTPRIVINGVDVQASDILYSGLAPGLIGVWQINFRVPQEVTAGNQVPLTVYLRSVASQSRTFVSLR